MSNYEYDKQTGGSTWAFDRVMKDWLGQKN